MTPDSPGGKRRGVTIYTDGGAVNNPGPGGYGAVLRYGEHQREISGGYRLTTNNRMELSACIEALKALKYPCEVTLHSDSRYVVDGITKSWARNWRKRGWLKYNQEPAENYDLWGELLDLCDRHRVDFKWVRGHAGDRDNERCDQLAKAAALNGDLPPDRAYEKGETRVSPPEPPAPE